VLDHKWKKGDQVAISYPMALHLIAANDDPHKAAIAYGPVVLAGEMGTEGLKGPAPYANDQNEYNHYDIPGDVISSLQTKGSTLGSWLKPVPDSPLTFKTQGAATRDITLIPYYEVHHERYVIYWDIE